MNTRVIALLVGIAAFLIRFLSLGAIENDHYVYLARAHQVLHGDWPVRDFVDPGIPLGVSAVGRGGRSRRADAADRSGAVGRAVRDRGSPSRYALVRRASGSTVAAVLAVAILLVVPPRLYNSSKMLVPVVAIALAWAYADRPSTAPSGGARRLDGHRVPVPPRLRRVRGGGDRHPAGRSPLGRLEDAHCVDRASMLGVAAAVVAPWLIYVQFTAGAAGVSGVGSALLGRRAESNRVALAAGLLRDGRRAAGGVRCRRAWNATTSARRTSSLPRSSSSRRNWSCCATQPGARLPDVSATTAIVAAIIVGRFMARRSRNGLTRRRRSVLTAALITVAGIALIAVRASIPSVAPNIIKRWQQVSSRLREARPEIMPDPRRAPLVRFIERCTAPDERVLVGGFGPELPVLAHRAFAGGLPDWIRGYYEHPDDVARARAQLGAGARRRWP